MKPKSEGKNMKPGKDAWTCINKKDNQPISGCIADRENMKPQKGKHETRK
jgi:hypothetical protein